MARYVERSVSWKIGDNKYVAASRQGATASFHAIGVALLGLAVAAGPLRAQSIALQTNASSTMTIQPNAPASMPAFSVRDQFDRTLTRDAVAGTAVLFLVASRDGADAAQRWSAALREPARARGIRVVSVADLKGAPALLRPLIRRDFPKDTSQAILMDFGGTLGRAVRGNRSPLVAAMYGADGRLVRALELPISSLDDSVRERLLAPSSPL